MAADTPFPRSWSDLPLDLAAAVLRRLPPGPLDRVRFGAVCPQWRAAARENPAMPPHFPWLTLPNSTFYSLPDSAFCQLPVQQRLHGHRQLPHAQTSCGEWLVFERQDGKITLMCPFSTGATMLLPGLHTLHPNDDEPFTVDYDGVKGPAIRKLVVCSPGNLVAAAVVDEPEPDVKQALCWPVDEPEPHVKLALCRPGAASWSWALVGGASVVVRDIVLYQGQLYALGQDWSLSAVSITGDGKPAVSRVDRCIANSITGDGKPAVSRVDRCIANVPQMAKLRPCYLVESGGALLMVTQYHARSPWRGLLPSSAATARFVVYVASFELSRWTMARTHSQLEAVLRDRVLFIGPWGSRSVAVGDQSTSVVGGSSVVFFTYEGLAAARCRKSLPFCCGVFDLKTRRRLQSLLQVSVQPPLQGFGATWLFPPSQPQA